MDEFIEACSTNVDEVKLLLELNYKYINIGLFAAIIYDKAEIVELLLEKGAIPWYMDNIALKSATINGHVGILELLVTYKETEDEYIHCLKYAISEGNCRVSECLLSCTKCDQRFVNWMYRTGNLEITKLLLRYYCPSIPTLLHFYVYEKHKKDLVKWHHTFGNRFIKEEIFLIRNFPLHQDTINYILDILTYK